MAKHTLIASMEALESWFKANKRPYYSLYSGTEVKQDKFIRRNEEVDDIDQAWSSLEETLNWYEDGIFHVFVTDKAKTSLGAHCNFRYGNPASGMPTRINGAGGGGFSGLYGSPQEWLAEQKRTWELEKRLDDLEASKSASLGHIDRFLENLVERPEIYNMIQMLGMKFLGSKPLPPAQPQPNRQPDNAPNGMAATDDLADDGHDYDRIEPALDTLQKAMGVESADVIEKLAAWANQNPEMAKSMLGQIG